MNIPDKNNSEKQTEESKKDAIANAKEGETIHTINPFTGTEVEISPEELEGIEKFNEAQTERD